MAALPNPAPNRDEASSPLTFGRLLGTGRHTTLFLIAVAVAALLWSYLAWQAEMPVWSASLAAAAVLGIPFAFKWQDDLRKYGLTAAVLSVLLVMQGFHTLEHVVQVIQYYWLDRPGATSYGLISALNAEWVHFSWNWFVAALLVYLYVKGVRNFFAKLLLVWAFAHGIEHTYMLVRYLLMLRELAELQLPALPVVQAQPGIFGRDGLLALSAWCGRIPGLTTAPRVAVHFWWNTGEIVLLGLAAWRALRFLPRPTSE